jgi:serpin B
MKTKIGLSVLLIGIILSCEKSQEDTFVKNPELETTEAKAFIANTNEFALDVFRTVASSEEDDNYMVSPISLSMALGMLHNGARGETMQAFDNVLGRGNTLAENNTYYGLLMESLSSNTSGTTLNLANAIWIKEGFPVEGQFKETNELFYKSDIDNLDFNNSSAVKTVNDWADGRTKGKIKDLVTEFDDQTRLFLANAIYFKSQWKYRFDTNRTIERPFYISEASSVNVPMMNMKAEVMTAATDLFSAIVLPYKGERYEMVLLLPYLGITTSAVLENIDTTELSSLFKDNRKSELEIALPRFTLEYEKTLNDVVTELGLGIAFANRADFTRINKETDLSISKLFQKTFIEVNEEGTEAAAVTGVEIGTTSVPPSFTADRPFLYIIREKATGTICFMGRVGNPK